MVSDDIGNINFAVWGFWPHTIMQVTRSDVSQGATTGHSNAATVLVLACGECEDKVKTMG